VIESLREIVERLGDFARDAVPRAKAKREVTPMERLEGGGQ
jgi:hypothetical protein